MPLYESLEIVITLRCVGHCKNCIRMCNTTEWSGLDYSDMDMSLGHVRRVIQDIRDVFSLSCFTEPVFGIVCVTGGEPLLHPNVVEITNLVHDQVTRSGMSVLTMLNTSGSMPIPVSLSEFAVTFSRMPDKTGIHQAMFIDPAEPGIEGIGAQAPPTYATCQHYRKHRVIVTRNGYNMCCASEGYTRLFGAEQLCLRKLPASPEQFPCIDAICAHCAYGAEQAFYERDVGCPISPVYRLQAQLNKAGRRLAFKLAEL